MLPDRRRTGLLLALTLVFAGYFMVWLPHESAGLSLIGLEMGEQSKFLPQVRSGEILPARSLFYIPPVTIGLTIVILSSRWPSNRWQTWVARALGPAVSLLAIPAFEALGAEPAEWLWRVLLIGFVGVAAIMAPILGRIPYKLHWAIIGITALMGAILPAWVFLEVRAAFSVFLREPMGVGLGFLLNTVGHLAVAALALLASIRQPLPA